MQVGSKGRIKEGIESRARGGASRLRLSFGARPLKSHRGLGLIGCALASLGLPGCSGVGEFEINSAESTVTFVSSTFPASEALGSGALVVALATTLPETNKEIRVTVADLGTGTATSGTDYASFDPVVITFPVGSVTGDTVNIPITTLPDTVAEGADETVQFRLTQASNASIIGITQTSVVIDDAHTASLSFDSATTVTPDESSASYNVTVTLDVTAGATLGFDVDVLLQDDGSGNASSGVDYAAFASTPVQFAAGTPSGAQSTVTMQVLDDADSEGLEFFAIHMTGAGLDELERDGPTRHVVNITDDESAPTALMTVTSGPTGSETTHAGSGESLALGIQVNNAGPNTGSLLIVSNAGGQPMQLGQPILIGGDESDFKVEVEGASLAGGTPAAAAFTPPSEFIDLAAPFLPEAAASLATSASSATALPGISVALDEAALVDLSEVDRVRFHGFPMPGGLGEVTLELERIPLPIASDAVVEVDGVAVAGGPAALLSDLTTWRGRAVEIPGSTAFVSFTPSTGPLGYIKLPYGENSTIHIASAEPATGTTPATSRLIHEADLESLPASARPELCGGELAMPGTAPTLDLDALGLEARGTGPLAGGLELAGPPPTAGVATVANCRLAIETDFQFYQKFGSSSDLTDYVTGLIAAISDQYFEDAQTTLSIAYLGIHTTSSDGWTTPDGSGDTEDMLNEFRGAWTGSGSWPVAADLAHFLSGANLGGGIAYLDVLCNQTFGFGVSANLGGNINWSTWTGTAGSFTWDFVVVAHELGHNFGASHTHEYCPALDSCYSGTCVSSTSCSQGTIMSYCHTCGGMDNIDLHFHPVISDILRSEVDSSCLGDAQMQMGEELRYRLRFDPRSGTGAKSTTLRFDHDAPNAPDPFEITLTGTAQ